MTAGRRNLFALAERLGMTVRDLESRLSVREYFEWLDFFKQPEEPLLDLTTATPDQLKGLFG